MDSLTHIVVGACVGELLAGRQLGKKAMLWGAVANSLPDIDIVAQPFMSTAADLLAHRGFTHSILFIFLFSPLLGTVFSWIFSRQDMSAGKWTLFWGIQMFLHIFIDSFNAYGTGWFEPFSHYRVSFNTLFVADPLITLWPFIGFIILLLLKKDNSKRRRWATLALSMSCLYFMCCVAFKLYIDNKVRTAIKNQGVSANRYFSTPTPLNSLLWFVVVESDSGYNTGYRSVFDAKEGIRFNYVPRNEVLLKPLAGNRELQQLERFSKGFYTAEMWHDTLVFNDLRFGDMGGWLYPDAKFAFHFYLMPPQNNDMVVQRGRFSIGDREVVSALLKRIKGN